MPSTKDECNRFLDNGNLYHLSFTFYDNYCITCSHLIGLDQSTSSCLVWTSTFSTILYKCLSMAIFENTFMKRRERGWIFLLPYSDVQPSQLHIRARKKVQKQFSMHSAVCIFLPKKRVLLYTCPPPPPQKKIKNKKQNKQ